jgi:uncharacterized protein YcbX
MELRRIKQIHRYPVKSMAGETLERATRSGAPNWMGAAGE